MNATIKFLAPKTCLGLGAYLTHSGNGILNPGPQDVAVALANQQFELGFAEANFWTGVMLLLFGIALVVVGVFLELRNHSYGQLASRNIIAFRHTSIGPSLPQRLNVLDLPPLFKGGSPWHIDCNHTLEAYCTPRDIKKGVDLLNEKRIEIVAQCESDKNAVVAYYGLAHIPFQFLAGHKLGTPISPILWELNQSIGHWQAILDKRVWQTIWGKRVTKLGATIEKTLSSENSKSAIIRISVSALVSLKDCQDVAGDNCDEWHIRAINPARSIITNRNQIRVLEKLFSDALREASERLPTGSRIHVFAALPMSVGYCMGRVVTSSMAEVAVYNFTSQHNPRYSWGIIINKSDTNSSIIHIKQENARV